MIEVDFGRDALFTTLGEATLRSRYMTEQESSPQEAFRRVCTYASLDTDHAARLYDYVSRHWFMFSTPLLSNGGTKRGLPISCFLGAVDDSREGILAHYEENAWLNSVGGGVAGDWSEVRSTGQSTRYGSQSSGVIPFIKVADAEVMAFSQGVTRRGSYAAYLDIDHPEIEEFIVGRKPSGGDVNRKFLNLHHGINVSDRFMQLIERCLQDETTDDTWALIDPHSQQVVRTVSARHLWQLIIETRVGTGEPYLHFIDHSNKHLPESLASQGLRVRSSNLCSEITLPTTPDRTAVCCLSSVNLAKHSEWADCKEFIPDLVAMLDCTIERFIEEAPNSLRRAIHSAQRERSIGLGAMGFHTLLQRRNIPFESALAESINRSLFREIKTAAVAGSRALAAKLGEAPDMRGTGLRNAHLLAIAPNASSSIICGGVSPGIEPLRANCYVHKTLEGSTFIRNRELRYKLQEYGKDTDSVWDSILTHNGSVQHLEFLPDWEKEVYRTALEIDQAWVIHHAAVRQEYICQAQSLNTFFHADANVQTLSDCHFSAWKKGLKSMYYLRSEAMSRAAKVSSQRQVQPVANSGSDECLSCEG